MQQKIIAEWWYYKNDIMVQDGLLDWKIKQETWYNYSPTGLLINLAEYDNGVKSGIYMEFDKGGALVAQEAYKNDKLDGEQKICFCSPWQNFKNPLFLYKWKL
ncbi:MAG: hypothetical protein IPI65_08485 [Bacteroidetes bacterium]|nr:hypothetical protein [Bacteroidota bacterium]